MAIKFIELILHLDKYLQLVIQQYPTMAYAFLFLIIFAETGFIVTPFLPGDSLLFTVGAFAAAGALNLELVFIIIFIASVLGDTVNYHAGKYLGPQVFKKEDSLFFHKKHLLRAKAFYEKYGGKTIILARFIPVIRTFAPFVAGIGTMSYLKFLSYNIIGALLWCSFFIFGGYIFGNFPFVKENFNLMIIILVVISLLPLIKEVISYLNSRRKQELFGEED